MSVEDKMQIAKIMVFLLMVGFTASVTPVQAEDYLIPANMVYVGYGAR